MAAPVLIVDVSNNNGPDIDWPMVARYGVRGAYLKATEGATFLDHDFSRWRREAAACGVAVGAYHFARPSGSHDWYEEAHHFAHAVGSVGRCELRPALDLEATAGVHGKALVAWARSWTRAAKSLLGVGPVFYSYPAFIHEMGALRPIGYGLWLASYGPNDGHQHPAYPPKPWRRYVLHQFTSRARVPGIKGEVDLNVAPRGLYALRAHPVAAKAKRC